ncbi:MAG: hypothetical protein ACO1OG_01825 [Devosia sp.]
MLGLVASMVGGSYAQDLDPTGVWVAEKNSDYAVSFCGPSGKDLCFELVGLRKNMDNPRNRPYLNTLIINRAKPNGANRWKGKMTLGGQSGEANIVMRGANSLNVKVCAMLVVCAEYAMTRVD